MPHNISVSFLLPTCSTAVHHAITIASCHVAHVSCMDNQLMCHIRSIYTSIGLKFVELTADVLDFVL